MDPQQCDDLFALLPQEVFYRILCQLPPQSISNISCVCKRFYALCAEPQLYKLLCKANFNIGDAEQEISLVRIDWKTEFKCIVKHLHEIFFVKPISLDETAVVVSSRPTHSNPFVDVVYIAEHLGAGQTKQRERSVIVLQPSYPLHPLPLGRCNIAYFEIRVLDIGDKEAGIGIGVAGKGYMNTMPGYCRGSIGWRGDGKLFWEKELMNKVLSSPWMKNDVIGCGINFDSCEIFFTRCGELISVSPLNKQTFIGRLFATVGMCSHGAKVEFHFAPPFEFDIIKYQNNLFQNEQMAFTPFSRAVRRVKNEPLFDKHDYVDDPRLAASYGFTFKGTSEVFTSRPAYFQRVFAKFAEGEFTDEDREELIATATELFQQIGAKINMKSAFPVLFQQNPDRTELEGTIEALSWVCVVNSIIYDITQWKKKIMPIATTEGLSREEDKLMRAILVAELLFHGDPQHPFMQYVYQLVQRERLQHEAAQDGNNHDINIYENMRFALFRAHQMLEEHQNEKQRLERMREVLTPLSTPANVTPLDDFYNQKRVVGQPDGYGSVIKRELEILEDPNIPDDDPLVMEVMWSEYLNTGYLDETMLMPLNAMRHKIFLPLIQQKYSMFKKLVKTDPRFRANVDKVRNSMELTLNTLQDQSLPAPSILKTLESVILAYVILHYPNAGSDDLETERRRCVKVLKKHIKQFDKLMEEIGFVRMDVTNANNNKSENVPAYTAEAKQTEVQKPPQTRRLTSLDIAAIGVIAIAVAVPVAVEIFWRFFGKNPRNF